MAKKPKITKTQFNDMFQTKINEIDLKDAFKSETTSLQATTLFLTREDRRKLEIMRKRSGLSRSHLGATLLSAALEKIEL